MKLVLFHQRCDMLRCCGCVWLPPIIFIRTHSLALVTGGKATLPLKHRILKLRIFLAQLHILESVETVT
ncbi:hypothetical protein SFRURICE_000882 [Spodoptera frugiperda]|nr:hypothetical protein SFRURICE_000882 [Spodoptera frugiperda]